METKSATRRPGRPARENILETILRTAMELFRERGYHAVTIEDIAARAEVSRGAIYHYVKQKVDLVEAIHVMAHELLCNGLREIRQSGESPAVQVHRAIFHLVRLTTAEMTVITMILQQEYILPPERAGKVMALREEYDNMLRQIVQEGIEDGSFIPCDVKMVTFAIIGAANYTPHWYSAKGRLSKDEIALHYANYLVRGLLKHPVE